jgi:hypothetical protein
MFVILASSMVPPLSPPPKITVYLILVPSRIPIGQVAASEKECTVERNTMLDGVAIGILDR